MAHAAVDRRRVRLRVSVPFTRGTPLWRAGVAWQPIVIGFSPLHEGDTSVAVAARRYAADLPFQSPSRGGHLCGVGTLRTSAAADHRFSPLHEGDTSVAQTCIPADRSERFSPLHEGDTSVAQLRICDRAVTGFQSPSRGGHLCGQLAPAVAYDVQMRFSPLHEGDTSVAPRSPDAPTRSTCVSVPFTRGTPLWLGTAAGLHYRDLTFQSPSRGGHLCGRSINHTPIYGYMHCDLRNPRRLPFC